MDSKIHEMNELIIKMILETIDEGVHVVNKQGDSIIYNNAMAEMEVTHGKDVLQKPFQEVFKNLTESESTLMQALKNNISTINYEQTYLNKDGRQITTVNTTVPVEYDGEVIAAIEIAKNITNIQKMSKTILDLHKAIEEPERTRERKLKKYSFDNLWGNSGSFKQVVELAKKAARSNASVFIYGDTGTGKELVAQSIHFDGERREKPFIAQNCAALPESLLEGILFGTEKGGFTGAVDRAGIFEQAHGGTLLLDEINSMPYELQGKLLRVLQEDYIRRVGGTKDIPVDVRIIATINEEPEALLKSGQLRRDLYYRLNIIQINMPPLSQRKEDILYLAEKFIEKHNRRFGKSVKSLSREAQKKLLDYNYPGNVRELENIIMAAVSLADEDGELKGEHILINKKGEDRLLVSGDPSKEGLDSYMKRIEKETLEHAMLVNGGNISRSAEYLHIKRQTLQHKLKKYNLLNGE